MAYTQMQILTAMERWVNNDLTPEDPNQPDEYKQLRNYWVQNFSATPSGAGTPASIEDSNGIWGGIKDVTSNVLQSEAFKEMGRPYDPATGISWIDDPVKAVTGAINAPFAFATAADQSDFGTAAYHSVTGLPDAVRYESALKDLVQNPNDFIARSRVERLKPEYIQSLKDQAGTTHPGQEQIVEGFKEGWGPGFSAMNRDTAATLNMLGQTLGRSPTSLVLGGGGALLGSLIGPGGTVGGAAAGSGIGGYVDERIGGTLRLLEEAGFDPTNEEHIAYLQENPEIFDLSEEMANKRARAIGVFSALSGGVSGGIGRAIMSPAVRPGIKALLVSADVPITGFLEGAGEGAAMLYSGEEYKPEQVKLEAAMGGLMGVPTLASAAYGSRIRQRAEDRREFTPEDVEAAMTPELEKRGYTADVVTPEEPTEETTVLDDDRVATDTEKTEPTPKEAKGAADIDGEWIIVYDRNGNPLRTKVLKISEDSGQVAVVGPDGQTLLEGQHVFFENPSSPDFVIGSTATPSADFDPGETLPATVVNKGKKVSELDDGQLDATIETIERMIVREKESGGTRMAGRGGVLADLFALRAEKERRTKGEAPVSEAVPETIPLESKAVDTDIEAEVREGEDVVRFNPTIIAEEANAKPTREEGKQYILGKIAHEADWHGGVFAYFASGAGNIGKAAINTIDAYVDNFYKKNKKAVDHWANNTPLGREYKRLNTTVAADGTEDVDMTTITKEYVGSVIAEGVRSGAIKDIVRNIRLFLKKHFKGFDFSEDEVRDLISSARRQLKSGKLSPKVAKTGEKLASRRVGLQDPSRRKFMKQTGGAIAGAAVQPSILLEPATAAEPVVESPTFSGMAIQYPGSAYEFAIQTDPSAGMLNVDDPGDTMLDVYITHDPNTNEVMVYEGDELVDQFEVDDMHADNEVLEYVRDTYGRENIDKVFPVRREEMDRDPETGEGAADYWGDADERYEQTAKDVVAGKDITTEPTPTEDRGPAYDFLREEKTPREPERKESITEKESIIEEKQTDINNIVEDILVLYDDADEIQEASQDGSLNQRIIMFTEREEVPFNREELWEAVNKRIEARDEPARLESRRVKPKSETVTRDINEKAKNTRTAIRGLDLPEPEKQERFDMLKRLGRIMGAPARKRGINAGDQDEFAAQADSIVAGDLESVEAFILPFEEKRTGSQEKTYKAQARRKQRAKRLDKTDAEILKYRPKGTKHPMEGKMTYPFALEEINKQEKDGDITSEEAEIRRLAVNNIRRVYKGKAGNTVKRIITEAAYGIGNYEDLVPWSETYTEEQAVEMGERAEVAQAEARRTRYEETDLTNKEKQDLLKKPPTAEEKAWVASDAMPSIKGKRNRLLFLRQPAEMSDAERNEFEAWKKDRKGFRQEEYKTEKREKLEEQVARLEREGKIKVERIPPQDVEKIQEEHRKIWQADPSTFDTLAITEGEDLATAFEMAGIEYRADGTPIAEGEGEVTFKGNVVDKPKTLKSVRLGSQEEPSLQRGIYRGTIRDLETLFLTRIKPENENSYVYKVADPRRDKEGSFGLVFKLEPISDISPTWYVKYKDGKYVKLKTHEANIKKREQAAIKRSKMSATKIQDTENRRVEGVKYDPETDTGHVDITEDEIEHLRGMHKLRALLNLIIPKKGNRARIVVEHIRNITPFVLEDGKRTSKPLHWQDKIRGRLTKNTKDNLVLISDVPDDIKTKFEKFVQSAAPYQDIYDMVNRGFGKDLTKKRFGITLEQAETVRDWRTYIQAELKTLKDTNKKITPLDLAKIIQSADTLIGNEYELNIVNEEVLENATAKIDQDVIDTVVDVMLNEFETDRQQLAEGTSETAKKGPAYFSLRELRRDKERAKEKDKTYSEHFSDGFWYRLSSFMWGKPVQAIRDFNKARYWGTKKGTIKAADIIADLFQQHQSSTMRGDKLETKPDYVQDVSMRTGEFYSRLSHIFAQLTNRKGVIEPGPNNQVVAYLSGKDVKFSSKEIETAAKELKTLIENVYGYALDETKDLESALNLRGEGDSLVPRVWNIEYLATRAGKAKFLRVVSEALSPPGKTTPIFEAAEITVDDLYDVVINSGGFVQGEWTNLKADQTRTDVDVTKDLKIQEYLDMLSTENLLEDGLVLDDLQAMIPRFIQKAVERTEYSKRFGKNDEVLRDLIKQGVAQIRDHNREVLKLKKGKELTWLNEKKFEKAAWDMARIARNKYGYDMANMSTRKWMQRGTNIAIVMKLPLVTLASMPEFFTPMLRGDVRPDKWFVDFMAASVWAGYKGMSGMSKLLFNKHLPAMRKMSKDLSPEGVSGVIRDIQLLRELGIADIQAMGDAVSTRYANPNFARGGLRAGATGTLAGKIPKDVRAVFNMQTFMQATLLTTMTEMQQLMALRNFQRHVSKRVQFINKNKGKKLTGREARIYKQFQQDLLDYGITGDIDLSTSSGEAEFNAGALRFIDQVITRPNDATTAKMFKNPLTAPLVLFKRFLTVFGNTLLVSLGNDIAHKVDNVERAKQVGKVMSTVMAMYGAVMFAQILRGSIKGDLDEEDFKPIPGDFKEFTKRLDRTGLLSAPGALAVNLAFPYKRGWWDSTEGRMMGELVGPLGGDITALGDALLSDKDDAWKRVMRQWVPLTKRFMDTKQSKRKKRPRRSGIWK